MDSPGYVGLALLIAVLIAPLLGAWLRERRRITQRRLWSTLPPKWRP